MSATYTIIPVALDRPNGPVEMVDSTAIYYKDYAGAQVGLAFGCFALRCNETGEVSMVDTGLASQEWMAKYNYPFAYERLDGAPCLAEALAAKGIDPAAVKTIIFTHLHQDHCCNLELFPNAQMYVQKVELQHAATPTPIERYSYQKLGLPGTPYWAQAFGQLVTIEGDRRIMPGVQVLLTPGHTPGSQTVVVETKEGPYLITGDNYYTQEQFTEARMNGNFTNLEGWYLSRLRVMDYVAEHGGQLLLLHDAKTYLRDSYG